jgi:dipeptidyl aminopeptidase/acylaminoacyl peptidase
LDLRSGELRQPVGLADGVTGLWDRVAPTFAPDGTRVAFSFVTPTRPMDVWQWELDTGRAAPVTRRSLGGVPATALSEPELVHYPSFDGQSIPAWLYRPSTVPASGCPVVVYVHGGPEGQTRPTLIPVLQYLVARGFAVLGPNVRGSSGYGRTYLALDHVEKRPDSVADLAHAVYWLREQPGFDAGRVAVYGGSYGGYMVLAALTSYPELWAGGVDVVGISNFVTFLENTGVYRRSHREAEYGSLERDRELLRELSPIHRADRIAAPLMVIHGANDPRVPLGEAEQMVAALREREVPVEILVYADEGHGLVRIVNKLDAYPRMAAFLEQHLRVGPEDQRSLVSG